ncbi:hypothetical protein ABFY60_10935 [Lysinibacillus pakistanensis]|uniref:hypothetical protein n=1 Tax=Lysinibacillus pakistanensis TaxID=759811 RepID=UPI003D2C3212
MKENKVLEDGVQEKIITPNKEYLTLESIKRSEARTLAMMRFIDNMNKVYKMDCKHLGEEAVRRYEMLLHFYINDVRKTYAEIAKLHNVHERTAQRYFKLSLHFAFS